MCVCSFLCAYECKLCDGRCGCGGIRTHDLYSEYICTTREETERAVEGPDCIIVALNQELAATIAPICNIMYCS